VKKLIYLNNGNDWKCKYCGFPLMLAPMEDVSDPPFRIICRELGADLVYTEFISSEGLIRNADKSVQKLDIYEQERPVGIQIFGGEIESMIECARIVEKAEPELLDINYGCPVTKVVCKDGGSGILRNIDKMESMTREIVKMYTFARYSKNKVRLGRKFYQNRRSCFALTGCWDKSPDDSCTYPSSDV